jgi:hypothetical protein
LTATPNSAHHRGVKRFLLLCALAGASFGIVASCGPERPFCPNNPPMYNCLPDSGTSIGGGSGTGGGFNKCPNGGAAILDGSGNCTCQGAGVPTYTCATPQQ